MDPGDLARVRQALVRELESVNTFEAMARQSSQPAARAALETLAQRARENVAALTNTLRALDAGQEAAFTTPGQPVARAPAAVDAVKGTPAAALTEELRLPSDPRRLIHALPAPPNPHAGQLTVGSLRGKK